MPHTKFERDMSIVQEHWNRFVSLIKKDFNDLVAEQKKIVIEIKRIERVEKIIEHSHANMDFLLMHKETILGLDNTLLQKFSILEAFKKRNNLSNAVAIRTFNEIISSNSIKNALGELQLLKEKRNKLGEDIDKISDLIYGTSFDRETIVKLSGKYNLSSEEITALALYPIFKSSKKIDSSNRKKTNLPRQSSKENIPNDEEIQSNTKEVQNKDSVVIEKPISYKSEFSSQKNRYEQITLQSNMLLNKYYMVLSEMTPNEVYYYGQYGSLNDEELLTLIKNNFEVDYDEAMAKIIVMKIFDKKKSIEKLLEKISSNNYTSKDDINYLEDNITEFKKLIGKLLDTDKKISKTKQEMESFVEPKVFFLTGRDMQPIIPDEIKESGYLGSLLNFIQKAQGGQIKKKSGGNVTQLKIRDKKFNDECGRTVFAIRNYKVIVSYIKMGSRTELNDDRIFILTSSLVNPNTIQESTNKIIKENREQIIRQIAAIERHDPQQIAVQSMIVDEIIQKKEDNLEEGDTYGRKAK